MSLCRDLRNVRDKRSALKRRSANLSYRRKYIGVSDVSSAPSPPCIPFSVAHSAPALVKREKHAGALLICVSGYHRGSRHESEPLRPPSKSPIDALTQMTNAPSTWRETRGRSSRRLTRRHKMSNAPSTRLANSRGIIARR